MLQPKDKQAKAAAVRGAALPMSRTAREVVSKQSACELGTAESSKPDHEARERPGVKTKVREVPCDDRSMTDV